MTCITILLADDHDLIRKGIRMVLAFDPDIEVVAEAVNGRQAIELARLLCPAVILMDVAMPLLDGFAATREIIKLCPATKVVMVSAHGDTACVARALAAGAVGYLHKQSSASEMREALKIISGGTTFVSPLITGANSRRDALEPILPPVIRPRPALTSREYEVLQLITDGKGNRQTASALDISVKTVEKHRSHIMVKLGIHDITGLTRFVLTSGIFAASPLLPLADRQPEVLPGPAALPSSSSDVASVVRKWNQLDRDPARGVKPRNSGRLTVPASGRERLVGKPDDR
jgi:DNA-binding NarL/FixJ family response regulator